MNFLSKTRRHAVQTLLIAGAAVWLLPQQAGAADPSAHATHAMTSTIIDFDTSSWAPLLAKGPRPAAYVFTNTFCPTCPAAFEALHKRVQAFGKPVELAAVVMDVSGNDALRHAHHYAGATHIYAFDGFEPEIRKTIDPKWRNITPYIVLIDRQGAVQRTIGPPDAAQLNTWLK